MRIDTDEGLTGWGEAFAYGAPLAVCNVIDETLAPLLVGEDPTRIEAHVDRLQRVLMVWGRRGLAMFAIAGVDLARALAAVPDQRGGREAYDAAVARAPQIAIHHRVPGSLRPFPALAEVREILCAALASDP